MKPEADQIRAALKPRPETVTEKWTRALKLIPGEWPTLTTTEAYWLFENWCRTHTLPPDEPILFGHLMKELGFTKGVKTIKRHKRQVFLLDEASALALLRAHRDNPKPADYRLVFDPKRFHDLGLVRNGMDADSPWNPYPPEKTE